MLDISFQAKSVLEGKIKDAKNERFSSYFYMTTRGLHEKFKSTQCLSPLLFVCLFVLNMENLDCFQNL